MTSVGVGQPGVVSEDRLLLEELTTSGTEGDCSLQRRRGEGSASHCVQSDYVRTLNEGGRGSHWRLLYTYLSIAFNKSSEMEYFEHSDVTTT